MFTLYIKFESMFKSSTLRLLTWSTDTGIIFNNIDQYFLKDQPVDHDWLVGNICYIVFIIIDIKPLNVWIKRKNISFTLNWSVNEKIID